jgi:hypothetical protein
MAKRKKKMNTTVTPIQASRQLLAVLASSSSSDFEEILRTDAFLQIWSDTYRRTYWSKRDVQQALQIEAEAWPNSTINIQSWDEGKDSATVQFQIWVKEDGRTIEHDRSLTITLRDDQIEMISLYRNEEYPN